MSDIPSPESSPAPESAPKPKLTLSPKAPAPAAPEAAAPAPAAAVPPAPAATISSVGASTSTPPSIAAAASRSAGLKPNLKLQGEVHPATPKTDAPAFQSPMPASSDGKPSVALFALSFIAAAAALAFAYLLYVKNQ